MKKKTVRYTELSHLDKFLSLKNDTVRTLISSKVTTKPNEDVVKTQGSGYASFYLFILSGNSYYF